MIKRVLISIAITLGTAHASGVVQGPLDTFEDLDEIPGVGTVLFTLRVPGEPVVAPAKFEILIECPTDEEPRVVVSVPLCKFISYKLERDEKVVTLSYRSGEVDVGGRVRCHQSYEKLFKLSQVCKKKPALNRNQSSTGKSPLTEIDVKPKKTDKN